jgi:hypothetical protein
VQPGLELQKTSRPGAADADAARHLGPTYSAFDPSGGSQLKRNLELHIPRERFGDRRDLLRQLDGLKRQLDSTKAFEGLDTFQQQAYDVILRGVADAFDLSKEDPKIVDRYDTSRLFKMEEVTKWHDLKRASNMLGKQMLLARRLCEPAAASSPCPTPAGTSTPTTTAPRTWRAAAQGGQVDHAVSAFIETCTTAG